MTKRGQVTIFIIIGIVIVVVAVLLFLFWPKIKSIFITPMSAEAYVEDCLSPLIKDNIKYISERGGSFNPQPAVMYNGINISYLCYINEYYKPCIMQKPLLKKSVEEELENSIKNKINSCFDEVKEKYQKSGFSVLVERNSFNVELFPQKIRTNINYTIITNKDGNTNRFDSFIVETRSNIYDFVSIASSILNWEARYGDSETTIYMTYYPNLKVEKNLRGDGTKIYTITDRNTKERFVFATRSVAWPAGYGADEVK